MSNIIVNKDELKIQAKELLSSGFLPAHIKNENQFIAIALKGMEVGMTPMQAISQINVIQGKPCISSEGMLALVFKNVPTASIVYQSLTNTECVIKARRDKDSEYSTFSFTLEDAKQAMLLGKDTWKKYPRDMLKARCITQMCRSLFPDAIAGISYTPEEISNDEVKIEKEVSDFKPVEAEIQAPKEVKEIPNRAPQIDPSERIVTYGTKYAGQRFKEVPLNILTEMYDHAKKNESKPMAKSYIKNYEDFFNYINNIRE